MGSHCDVASFVLRFKQHIRPDATGTPQVEWRGHIRHVQHDGEKCFTEMEDAVAFIRQTLATVGTVDIAGAPVDLQITGLDLPVEQLTCESSRS